MVVLTTKQIYKKIIYILCLVGIALNTGALTVNDVETIIKQPGDIDFIAQNLRSHLGRRQITKGQAEAIVTAFRKKEPWQHLVPSTLIDAQEFSPMREVPTENSSSSNSPEPTLIPPSHNPHLKKIIRRIKYHTEAKKAYKAIRLGVPVDPPFIQTVIAYPDKENMPENKSNPDLLTADQIRQWLKEQGLINDTLFKDSSCLRVERGRGGASTEQLFLIKYKPHCLDHSLPSSLPYKLLFIVKILKQTVANVESTNLKLVQNHPLIVHLRRLRDPSFPQLTFGENFYTYRDSKQQLRALSLLHPAKGDSLLDLVLPPLGSIKEAKKAYSKLGEVLANFHKKFMEGPNCLLMGGKNLTTCKTITHGDLHAANIFYDGKFIYFIDLETMINSLRTRQFFIEDAVQLGAVHVKSVYDAFLTSYVNHLTSNHQIRNLIKETIQKKIELS